MENRRSYLGFSRCFIVASLLILCTVYLINRHLIRDNTYSENDSIDLRLKQKQAELLQLEDLYLSSIKSSGIFIAKVNVTHKSTGKQTSLIKLAKAYNLFLVISDFHCFSCVKEIVDIVKQEKDIKTCILLQSHSKESEDAISLSIENAIQDIYICKEIKELPVEEHCSPYFFQLANTGVTSRIFLPIKEKYSLTKNFLSIVSHKTNEER